METRQSASLVSDVGAGHAYTRLPPSQAALLSTSSQTEDNPAATFRPLPQASSWLRCAFKIRKNPVSQPGLCLDFSNCFRYAETQTLSVCHSSSPSPTVTITAAALHSCFIFSQHTKRFSGFDLRKVRCNSNGFLSRHPSFSLPLSHSDSLSPVL